MFKNLSRAIPLTRSISSSIRPFNPTDCMILGAKRTPIGSFLGSLSSLPASELAAIAIKSAIQQSGVKNFNQFNDLLLGNIGDCVGGDNMMKKCLQSADLPPIPSCRIAKVCASGMKAVMLGALQIQSGYNDLNITGGTESMSQVPYLLLNSRSGLKFGHRQIQDGMILDELWDVYTNQHMGSIADKIAKDYNITREEQDKYAIESYNRSLNSIKTGLFDNEIAPVQIKDTIISQDEEPSKVLFDKITTLKPAFNKEGSITAANASKINDGASALVLSSYEYMQNNNLTPIGRIIGFGDSALEPTEFPVAPVFAVPPALKRAGVTQDQIDYWEANEAFSVVALGFHKLLNIPLARINVNGGAVALGHPVGNSGSRIIVTLLNILKQRNARLGCAAICNGAGGASAIVVENLS